MSKCGIYKIVNIINGNYYVGSAINIDKRWWRHKSNLIHNKHFNPHLQFAWNKYGKENFCFMPIEYIENPTKEKLLKLEQQYLDIAKDEQDKCYNATYNADSPNFGVVMPIETKEKISKSLKGKILSNETKRKISETRKGMVFSIEHRNNISKSSKGRIPWSKGKTHSAETKEKMRLSAINRWKNKQI